MLGITDKKPHGELLGLRKSQFLQLFAIKLSFYSYLLFIGTFLLMLDSASFHSLAILTTLGNDIHNIFVQFSSHIDGIQLLYILDRMYL